MRYFLELTAIAKPTTMPETEKPSSFKEFRLFVLRNPQLHQQLIGCDPAEFVEVVISIANQHGFELSADNLAEAMNSAKRQWVERWI